MMKQIYLTSNIIAVIGLCIASVVENSFFIVGGVLIGYLLGMFPLVTWHFVIFWTDGFRRKDRVWVAVVAFVGKFSFLGMILYLAIQQNLTKIVNPLALLSGISIIVATLLLSTFFGKHDVQHDAK